MTSAPRDSTAAAQPLHGDAAPAVPGVQRHADADSFLAAAATLLARNPAAQAFIHGICEGWRAIPEEFRGGGYAATFEHYGALGLALRRAAGPLLLEHSSALAAAAFAHDMPEALRDLGAVHGEEAAAEAFARAWGTRFGGTWRTGMRLRHHMLVEAREVAAAPGRMRVATQDDLAWLEPMSLAFAAEVGLPDSTDTILRGLRARVGLGRYRVWEDDGAVAFAAWTPTGAAARIAPVCTRAEARRRGYATTLTAALVRELLDSGRRPLFLFTDVANPTSNAIYRRIGFEPVSDVVRIDFTPAAA